MNLWAWFCRALVAPLITAFRHARESGHPVFRVQAVSAVSINNALSLLDGPVSRAQTSPVDSYAPALARCMNSGRNALLQSGGTVIFFSLIRIAACFCR